MAKVYVRAYTNKAVAKAQEPLVVPVSKKTCFQIPFPSEGFLQKLVVYQVPQADGGGAPVAFEVELLNSLIPFPPDDYGLSDVAADRLEPYRVQMPPTAPLSATSGSAVTLVTDDFGQGYRNLDGSYTANQNFIYLLIKPSAAAGETQWCAFLQIKEPR